MPLAVFNQVNIVSRDPEASLAFYRLLGVALPEDRIWRTGGGPQHISGDGAPGETHFDIDSVPFAPHWNAGWAGRTDLAGKVVVGFRVDERADVDAVHDRLAAAGHRTLQEPWDAFWGSRFAIVEDPDGIAVGIMSPMCDAHRRPPPDL